MPNDLGRYRKLYVRLWRHPGFTKLSNAEKILALYLLTGVQTNRIGLYKLSLGQALDDLGARRNPLLNRLRRVSNIFGWSFDERVQVLFIPSWFRWNPPENANVMKGILKDLSEIPPCGLVELFAANIETVPVTLREAFIEGLQQRLPKPFANQEQEQEQDQKQEQETALRAVPHPSSQKKNSPEQNHSLIVTARQLFQLVSAKRPIDELVDAFFDLHRRTSTLPCTRLEAMSALNAVLTERRKTSALA